MEGEREVVEGISCSGYLDTKLIDINGDPKKKGQLRTY